MLKKLTRFILDILQFIFISGLVLTLKVFSFETVSNFPGTVGRRIGMRLPHRKRAYKSLQRAMPELSSQKQDEIVAGMFDNLTRTLLEYIVCFKVQVYGEHSRVEVVGQDIIDRLRDDDKPAILFLAHLANWEMGTLAGIQKGLPIVQVYRKLNYPLTDKLINWVHRGIAEEVITKGQEGARQMMKVLKEGKHISMLSDQKLREGEWIPFFGIPAKTPAAGARLALKYDYPFVPVRVERIEKTRFRVTYYPPLTSLKTTPEEQLTDLLTQMNQCIETWIRARPEQWFWLHRRWP